MKGHNLKNVIGGKGVMILGGFLILFVTACGTSRAIGDDPEAQNIENLINSREFEIENEWMMPLGGNMMNLIGNPNFIRMKGDSVDIFLPYFGVRHSGGGYGSEGGIKYEGPAEDFSITHNERQNSYMLRFDGDHESENLRFMITIYQNGDTNTSVNSSQRNTISYRGRIRPLKEE